MRAGRVAYYGCVGSSSHLKKARNKLGHFSIRHAEAIRRPTLKRSFGAGFELAARRGLVAVNSLGIFGSESAINFLGTRSLKRILPPEVLLITDGENIESGLTFHVLRIEHNDTGIKRAEILVEALYTEDLFPDIVACIGRVLGSDRSFHPLTLEIRFKNFLESTILSLGTKFPEGVEVTADAGKMVVWEVPKGNLRVLSV